MSNNSEAQIKSLSARILKNARDSIIINMRFLDVALAGIHLKKKEAVVYPLCDGKFLYYDDKNLLIQVKKDNAYAIRMYLHVLFHWIFSQPFSFSKIKGEYNRRYFSLACDIATEAVIMSFDIMAAQRAEDDKRRDRLRILRKYIDQLTAQNIYRYFLANEPSEDGLYEMERLFTVDDHSIWDSEQATISLADWQKLSERIKADVKTFSKDRVKSEGLSENLEEATRDRYDYADILRHFTVLGEDVHVNDEEFDYIYYTYGLSIYENMPLVEPLEYKDVKKVREFVIVLDTSASCQGSLVRSFLKRTYSILKSEETFFSKINVHILQCDNSVQNDLKITSDEDFEAFLKNGKLTGFGATDYRPAFEHIDELKEKGEFDNLKGVIYFTDGYGVYPEYMPDYEAMFVFPDEDPNRAFVPPWVIKVILGEEFDETEEISE